MKRPLPTLLAWLVGALLLVAGVVKARSPETWYLDLTHYRLLPDAVSRVLTWYVPALEVVTGLALVTGKLRTGAWWLSVAFGVVFVGFVGSAWSRGLDITCGCFGGKESIGLISFSKSLLFLSLSLFGAYAQRRSGLNQEPPSKA